MILGEHWSHPKAPGMDMKLGADLERPPKMLRRWAE